MDGVLELRIISTTSVKRLESRVRVRLKVLKKVKDRPLHLRKEVSLDGNLQKSAIQGRQ